MISPFSDNWLLDRNAYAIFVVVVTCCGIAAALRFIDRSTRKMIDSKRLAGEEIDPAAVYNIKLLGRIVIWALGAFFVMTNLGYNATSLLTGLGISGIAVALAIQNILGDIFSFVSIMIDKPFVIGDYIVIGEDMGTVEKIGVKSTRLRQWDRTELIVSNRDLTSSRVQNLRKISERRICFEVEVDYGTPTEKLESIPVWIKEIFAAIDHEAGESGRARLESVHFRKFGDAGLMFEITYVAPSRDYYGYCDVQHEINLRIHETFQTEGVEFAHPR